MKKYTFLLGAILVHGLGYASYTYDTPVHEDLGYEADEEYYVYESGDDVSEAEVEENPPVAIPERDRVRVSGPIDTLIVDRAYYTGIPTANVIVTFKDKHTIKTKLFYVPETFLQDITEKDAFGKMFDNIYNLWQEPTEQEYLHALDVYTKFNHVFVEKFIVADKRQFAVDMSQRGLAILQEKDQYSDVEFVRELINIIIDNASIYDALGMYQNLAFYEQHKEEMQKNRQKILELVKTIDSTLCIVTPTMVNDGIVFIKTMNLDLSTLMRQIKPILNSILPEMVDVMTDEGMAAVEVIIAGIVPKLVSGFLSINLGETFEQYHAKRQKEVDYIILEKIVQSSVLQEVAQNGSATIALDEKTNCEIVLTENMMTGEPLFEITCTTTI